MSEKTSGSDRLQSVIEKLESIRFDLDYESRLKENETAIETNEEVSSAINNLAELADEIQTEVTDFELLLFDITKNGTKQ